ncbi:hypothetical protein FRC00_009541 [Tulasnella sp. 408]|nr:hypothetical protein FRC00_009541 [Tulasnella sp. 408]
MALAQALPPELLSLAFCAVYNDAEDDKGSVLTRTSYELLDVLLVCRRWNDVACRTPELWTSVYVAHNIDSSARAEMYAARAGRLALDVIVTSAPESLLSTGNCEIALQQVLRKHTRRLRSITLPFSTPKISKALRAPLANLVSFICLPITRSDELISSGSDLDPSNVTLDTPKLQTLILHKYAPSFVENNWPSLKSLKSLCCFGQERWLWGLLGASQPTLEDLVLGDATKPPEMWAGHSFTLVGGLKPCISLPSLTSLEFNGTVDVDWGILHFADMPALTSLTLSLLFLPASQDQERPLPKFERLRYLSLTTVFPYGGVDLNHLLQSTPHITSLTLDGQYGEDDADEKHIINSLLLTTQLPSTGPLLCPELEEISILAAFTPPAKLKELVDLRLPRLRKVRFYSSMWLYEPYPDYRDVSEWVNGRVEPSGFGNGWDKSEPQFLA